MSIPIIGENFNNLVELSEDPENLNNLDED